MATLSLLLTGGMPSAGGLPSPTLRRAAPLCSSGVPGDVNGDGYAEVVASENGPTGSYRGAVHLFYGQPRGLVANATGTALDDQYFTQDTPGIPDKAEDQDNFEIATLGDFNDDGCADLAVGAWGERFPNWTIPQGTVTVLYGSPAGITTVGVQVFSLAGLFDGEVSDSFGSTLAVGDLNDDGIDDLAVGAPSSGFDDDSDLGYLGAVAVLFGDVRGLNQGTTPAARLSQDALGAPGARGHEHGFGGSLAVGDFDGDGIDELAIASLDHIVDADDRGAVQTVERGPAGYGATQPALISQDTPGVPGVDERHDDFGWALAAGDVDGDGFDDLAVGVPGENATRKPTGQKPPPGAGSVVLLFGSADGLTGEGSQRWSQDTPGVPGAAGSEDRFGSALAMARLDAGSTADLAIGAPSDAVGSAKDTGSTTVLFGGSSGLTAAGAVRLHQDVAGIAGRAERGDGFGARVTAAYVQSPTQASLVIGATGETLRGLRQAGQLHQLSIDPRGPDPVGSRTLHLGTAGVKGKPRRGGFFG